MKPLIIELKPENWKDIRLVLAERAFILLGISDDLRLLLLASTDQEAHELLKRKYGCVVVVPKNSFDLGIVYHGNHKWALIRLTDGEILDMRETPNWTFTNITYCDEAFFHIPQ